MSTIVKADASGAVMLPAELCRAAGLAPGADLIAQIEAGRIILEQARPSLTERIVARARVLPQETVDKLPVDGASQHDHYIYGTPKRSV